MFQVRREMWIISLPLAFIIVERPPEVGAFNGWWMIPVAYLIGATPFGFLAGKLKGLDIRDHGSGNIGATNVLRVLGKPVGITTLILDILKGLVPVLLTQKIAGPDNSIIPIGAAIATILGHNYTFWLGFKGGKGIATSAGAIAPLIPIPLLAAIILWLLSFAITRYVSVASIVSALTLPAVVTIQGFRSGNWDWPLLVFTFFLAVMATWRHRANIKRLFEGTENRFVPNSQRPETEKKTASSPDA